MGTITQLEIKSNSRHAAEMTTWALERDVAALEVLANEGTYFFDLEVADMRRAAYSLLAVADQVSANMKLGSK